MSYKATVVYTGDGIQTTYSFGFEYLKKSFVKVQLVSGTILTYGVDYTILSHDVVFVTAPTGIFTVYRETDNTPLVSWVDASILKAVDMNLTQVQQEHIIEESSDKLSRTSMVVNETTNQWEGRNLRLTNVANPVDSGDVATKGYIEGVQSGLISAITSVKNTAIETIEGLQETIPAEIVQAKKDAVIAKDGAETARDEAVIAKDGAETARDEAETVVSSIERASQAEAEEGTDNIKLMTPLCTSQAITAKLATQVEAEVGTDNTKLMTPLRVAEAIIALEFKPHGGTGVGQFSPLAWNFTNHTVSLPPDGTWAYFYFYQVCWSGGDASSEREGHSDTGIAAGGTLLSTNKYMYALSSNSGLENYGGFALRLT